MFILIEKTKISWQGLLAGDNPAALRVQGVSKKY